MNRIFDISELSEDGKRALEMNIRFALKTMEEKEPFPKTAETEEIDF